MSYKNGLPSGWVRTTLGAVRVDRSSSIDPSKSKAERFELYSIPAFASGTPEIVMGMDIGSTKKSLVPGTVVVSKINPRINRVWVVGERSEHRKIGSSEWIPFFPIDGLNPKYLAYYMRQDAFRNYLASNVSGVGGSLMRVRPSTVDPFPLVLAPNGEQTRIVEALESYFSRLDEAESTLTRVQQSLGAFCAAVLKAAVEGRLVPTEAELARAEDINYESAAVLLERILAERRRRWGEVELAKMSAKGKVPQEAKWKAKYREPMEADSSGYPELPEGWTWATLDQLTTMIDGGTGTTATSEWTSRPVLRSSAVRQGSIDFNDHRFLPDDATSTDLRFLGDGDLLFTRLSGTLAFVGNCAVVPPLMGRRIEFPDRIFRARVIPMVGGEYISYCFGATHLRRGLEAAAKSTAGHQRISLPDLKSFCIPLPPFDEQTRIVESIKDHLSVVQAIEVGFATVTNRISRLRQSILKWAFEGKLADQYPSDEPAAELLERIGSSTQGDTKRPQAGLTKI